MYLELYVKCPKIGAGDKCNIIMYIVNCNWYSNKEKMDLLLPKINMLTPTLSFTSYFFSHASPPPNNEAKNIKTETITPSPLSSPKPITILKLSCRKV